MILQDKKDIEYSEGIQFENMAKKVFTEMSQNLSSILLSVLPRNIYSLI